MATVIAIGAIRSCGSTPRPIASLSEIIAGSADKSIKDSDWTAAATGDSFRMRDAVRTSALGAARLTFHNGAVLRLGPETTLRFGAKLSLSGEIQNESSAPTTLELAGNANNVKLEAGAKIRVSRAGSESNIEVLIGSAVVTRDGGEIDLEAGDEVIIFVGPGFGFDGGPGRPVDAAPSPLDAAAPEVVSVTLEVSGGGVRAKEAGDAKQTRLTSGTHQLPAGASVSLTRRKSVVVFSRGEQRAEVRGKGSAVVGSGESLLALSRGRATVIGGGVSTAIAVPGGQVTAISSSGRESTIDVVVARKTTVTPKSGRADVVSSKARERIQIGERIEITREGDIAVIGRQPSVADFSVRAGQSASIHDPGAPTAVRIRFEDKCSDGVVEWKSGRTTRRVRGPGSAITSLKPGTHRYKIRCFSSGGLQSAEVSSGRFNVDRNSGTKRLPARAPENFIEATGEDWNILYQNLLPNVTIRWPNAKKEGRYKLFLKRSSAAAKVYTTRGASHKIKSVSEGSYRFWFEGSGTRSKEGVMTIKFDNATQSGYLRRPRVGRAWSGGQVLVEGAGTPGTKVSVGGVPIGVDSQTRFKADVARPSSEQAIAVKMVAPRQGTHYYVRRDGRR